MHNSHEKLGNDLVHTKRRAKQTVPGKAKIPASQKTSMFTKGPGPSRARLIPTKVPLGFRTVAI